MGMHSTLAGLALCMLSAGSAMACPDWESPPSFGQIELWTGFQPDPYVRNVTAGGRYDLAGCFNAAGWGGSVARKPDFDLYWNGASSAVTIAVRAQGDAVLLVNAPDGQWYYSDNSASGDEAITFQNPQEGLYDIWIGAYNGGRGIPGQLIVTER